jgi:hypothetical protein
MNRVNRGYQIASAESDAHASAAGRFLGTRWEMDPFTALGLSSV